MSAARSAAATPSESARRRESFKSSGPRGAFPRKSEGGAGGLSTSSREESIRKAPQRTAMLDLAHRHLSEEKTRALLRKLRDLNLSAGPIALSSHALVAIAGCVS